jgi:GntR family transcriptional repressor for pyruvate dehydrogenase complex
MSRGSGRVPAEARQRATVDPLRPVVRRKLYEELVQRLRAYIEEAGLQPGDRLLSERELAARLDVSRNTLTQAIAVLEVQGFVQAKHGGGLYLVRGDLRVEPIEALLARQQRLPDILDAREALETKLAELAAQRRSAEDVAALDAALEFMAAEVAAGGLGEQGDLMFHRAVVAAAHSPVLAAFYDQLSRQIAETRLESLRQPMRPPRSLRQHHQIAKAIGLGDGKRAAAAARRHVEAVRKVRLLTWKPDVG